jgi:hypothetical protein
MMGICTFGLQFYQVIHGCTMRPATGGEPIEETVALIIISCRRWTRNAHIPGPVQPMPLSSPLMIPLSRPFLSHRPIQNPICSSA